MMMATVGHLYAGVCFWVGLAILGVGVGFGLRSNKSSAQLARAKVETAKAKVATLTTTAVAAANEASSDQTAAQTAQSTGEEASNLLDDLSGILASFPEVLRFPVFLVLVGGALMSVATVQFGGQSIF